MVEMREGTYPIRRLDCGPCAVRVRDFLFSPRSNFDGVPGMPASLGRAAGGGDHEEYYQLDSSVLRPPGLEPGEPTPRIATTFRFDAETQRKRAGSGHHTTRGRSDMHQLRN